jgi:hypothetical protein
VHFLPNIGVRRSALDRFVRRPKTACCIHDNLAVREEKHEGLTVTSKEMTPVERESQAQTVDDIELDS